MTGISKIPLVRAALLRPSCAARAAPMMSTSHTQIRLATSGPHDPNPLNNSKEPVHTGTDQEFNETGSGSNKNIMYISLGGLTLGAFYAVFMAKPDGISDSSGPKDAASKAARR
ncbi:hypothetical protein B0T17DRAFT_615057 [Bombardia bombarda]|uniref:Uncharacterized protein n=1 Tax=Bombardia bombarda TaxID=252184 RepID=A0AA39X8G2_9PEZI|nr:hypothetical protein B0T17DRAFT_615057 [Bombardia bombarda]